MTKPEHLDALWAMQTQFEEVGDWLEAMKGFLKNASARSLCVASKALQDHPEWKKLKPGFSLKGAS